MSDYMPNERDFTLGLIIWNPELIEDLVIPDDSFRTDAQLTVWTAVQELREARQPVTLASIEEHTGIGLLDYLDAITSGAIPITFTELQRRIYKQAAENLQNRRRSLALAECPDEDEIAALSEEIWRLQLCVEGDVSETEPTSFMLSEIERKDVSWLWRNFIPLGRATLISGDPGSAKTWFCLDLAARLSRGLPWADVAPGFGRAKTLYLTVEDDLHDTIRPRIDSLGGDPSMIAVYNSEHPLHMDLSKSEGLARLEKEIVRLGDVRLVVVDPIIDFSGKSNPNAAEEVRTLLTPLVRLASKLNFALVLVGHLNKAQTLSAIYRAGGSTSGWLGKCRASLMIFRDIHDKALRHVAPIKCNLAPEDPPQLEFTIQDGKLNVLVSTVDVNIDEQLNPKGERGPDPAECNEASAWLKNFFADRDEIPATEVEAAARSEGISETTLKRAKKKAGFRSKRITDSSGRIVWVWVKPGKGA